MSHIDEQSWISVSIVGSCFLALIGGVVFCTTTYNMALETKEQVKMVIARQDAKDADIADLKAGQARLEVKVDILLRRAK